MATEEWSVKLGDIEWQMDWLTYGKPEKGVEDCFEDGPALGVLLINEVIFLNDHWWEDDWPDAAKKLTSLNVNCNDVFAWGCADAEEVPHGELQNLWRMWRKDPAWGAAVWCMVRRNQMPQKPVEKLIREAGIWDLDRLALGKNTMDGEVHAYLAEVFGKSDIAKALPQEGKTK